MPRSEAADRPAILAYRGPAPTAGATAGGASRRTRLPAPDEDHLARSDPVSRAGTRADLGFEPRSAQQREPGVAAERAKPMRLGNHTHGAIGIAEGELVLGEDPVISRNWIGRPLAEAGLPTGSVVTAASPGTGAKGLGRVVGHENYEAAGATMRERRADDTGEILLARHVVDCIVHEHSVELAAEP